MNFTKRVRHRVVLIAENLLSWRCKPKIWFLEHSCPQLPDLLVKYSSTRSRPRHRSPFLLLRFSKRKSSTNCAVWNKKTRVLQSILGRREEDEDLRREPEKRRQLEGRKGTIWGSKHKEVTGAGMHPWHSCVHSDNKRKQHSVVGAYSE